MHTFEQTIQTLIFIGAVGLFVMLFSAIASWWLNRKKQKG